MKESQTITREEITKIKGDLYLRSPEIAKKFAPIFQKNNWTWSRHCEPYGTYVPKEQDIEITINCLIKYIYHGCQSALVATGRIQIRVVKCEHSLETRVELVADSVWI